jgi:transglutaminase-like putative cysteine protease
MSTSGTGGRTGNLMGGGFGSARLPVSAALATILASICLGSSFLTGAWFFPATFAVLVTVGGAELARRMSAPRSFVPVVGAVALLVYLVLLYAREEAYLWVVPNRDALLRLQDLVTAGRLDISRFAAPIAVSPGIELLAAAGVGLVALAVDTLAVTMRRAALAGLPLLVLYTVPTTVAPGGVGWLAFALGGVGYLTLLLAEARERVSRWGRPMRYSVPRPNWRPDVETAPLAQVGRRVGAAALGLALVVPAVLPNFDASTFGFGGNGFGNGSGHGRKVNVVNPIIDLGRDLRRGQNAPVISYTGRPDYLRLVGLDLFNGDKWDPSPSQVSNRKNDVREGLISAPGLSPNVDAKVRNRSFKIFDLEETWLPLPYPTRKVTDIDGKWLYDESTFNVFPFNGSTRQISYKARSLELSPTAGQLRSAGTPPDSVVAQYTQLPPEMPKNIIDAANDVTKGAVTAFDKGVLLQQWLRSSGNFVYNTDVADTLGDANGLEAISRFIDTRQGYCVHFASTMAVMARQLNIPSRVAVGFTAGTFDKKTGRNIVTLHDAHAWPELYFQGVGWVRFEPTPGGARTPSPGFTQNTGIGNNAPTIPGQTPTTAPTGPPGPQSLRAKEQELLGALGNPSNANRPSGPVAVVTQELPILPVGLTIGVLLLGLVPLSARAWVRRRRWRRATSPAALAAATWAELLDTLLDYGYEWPASDPPRKGAVRLAEERGFTGESYEALRRLAAATERARYATELGAVGDLRSDVETIRATLAAQASRVERLRARFLPRSARAVSSAISEQLADVLDSVDSLGARPRPRRAAG